MKTNVPGPASQWGHTVEESVIDSLSRPIQVRGEEGRGEKEIDDSVSNCELFLLIDGKVEVVVVVISRKVEMIEEDEDIFFYLGVFKFFF